MTGIEFKAVLEHIIKQITRHIETSSVAVTSEITHSFTKKRLQRATLNYNQYIDTKGGSEVDVSIQDEQKNRWNIITRESDDGFEAKLTLMGKGKSGSHTQEVRYVKEQEIPGNKIPMIEQMQKLVNGMLKEMEKEETQLESKIIQNSEREIGD